MAEVRDKTKRIHFKSLGGILALQEEIGRRWQTIAEPAAQMRPAEPAAPRTAVPAPRQSQTGAARVQRKE
jgi:hypothetical protein